MTQEHPITPPEELVDQWNEAWIDAKVKHEGLVTFIATQAACWGADQELEACCHLLRQQGFDVVDDLRATRRPKPPSLKEQALAALDDAVMRGDCITISDALPTIRRALEQLDD
jgi:hypothetical protein